MSHLVPLTNVAAERADRDEYLDPWSIARVEPHAIAETDGTTTAGARVTLNDNADTVLVVAESAAEVNRRVTAARLPAPEPTVPNHPNAVVFLEMAFRAAVNKLPWTAIKVFAWGWALYQIVRVVSLLQDIVHEQIRMSGRESWADSYDEVVLAGVTGAGFGVALIVAFVLTVGVTWLFIGLISLARWAWRWWRSTKP